MTLADITQTETIQCLLFDPDPDRCDDRLNSPDYDRTL
jgi:hypothetical protein